MSYLYWKETSKCSPNLITKILIKQPRSVCQLKYLCAVMTKRFILSCKRETVVNTELISKAPTKICVSIILKLAWDCLHSDIDLVWFGATFGSVQELLLTLLMVTSGNAWENHVLPEIKHAFHMHSPYSVHWASLHYWPP